MTMEETQSFRNKSRSWLITKPGEVGRLFWSGYMHAPNVPGKRWNVAFCPGMVGSWTGFKICWKFAGKCFKWGWSPDGHGKIIKSAWNAAASVEEAAIDFINGIPDGVSKGGNNISKLWEDTPFGWIPRVLKNAIWNCFVWPIVKAIIGAIGCIVGAPLTFFTFATIGCVGKWLIGNLVGVCSLITSLAPSLGGAFTSAFVAFGSLFNRFPKEADNGTYGLYLEDIPCDSEDQV
ncbi:Hypothetical protein HVR_LOCUS1361 [uncultured virus]|nr:Hypothetical protein HVR_LOCUS1361 [uncultured virus]